MEEKEKDKCPCKCHERHHEAALKNREARKEGKFYYYHEDCFCCFRGFGLGPGDSFREKGR